MAINIVAYIEDQIKILQQQLDESTFGISENVAGQLKAYHDVLEKFKMGPRL